MESTPGNEAEKDKDIFDPNDPWDAHIAWIGRSLYNPKDFGGAMPSEDKLFEIGRDYVGGRHYEDGFGSFGPGDGEWADADGPLPPFDEKLVDGSYRAELDFAMVGQPDGPGSEGHIWAARLWDRKEQKEVPETRVFGEKLSHAVAAALRRMPSWGKEEWQPSSEEMEMMNIREFIWRAKEAAVAFDHHWAESEKSEAKDRIRDILENEFPLTRELIEAGGGEKWIESNLGEDSDPKEIASAEWNIGHICSVAYSLIEYFKDPEAWKNAYPNDEIFLNKMVEDEGEGWMKAPEWR